jgi:hypothetical protein
MAEIGSGRRGKSKILVQKTGVLSQCNATATTADRRSAEARSFSSHAVRFQRSTLEPMDFSTYPAGLHPPVCDRYPVAITQPYPPPRGGVGYRQNRLMLKLFI